MTTIYEGLKRGHLILASFGWAAPLIGLLSARIFAFIAVRWMVGYLIAIAVLAGALLLTGAMS
jgi:hypothetical protein